MKTKALIFTLCFLALTITFISCGEDDDITIPDIVENDRTEQQVIDDSTLVDYLSNHYYNSGFFETGSNHEYTDIVITKLEEGEDIPAEHTLLLNAVGAARTTVYLDTEYKYYVLNLNQGGGESPKFTDQVFMRYEGTSINNDEIFDAVASPLVLNLQSNFFSTLGVIKGWQLIIPTFNTATDYSINNGVVNYSDFGLGVMFLPSGLSYFSGSSTGTTYDNLMFKFELIRFEQEDHDSDGIPSYIEDIDNSLEVTDDDTDEDNIPDFVDADDDNDGVNTIDELMSTTYTVDTNMGESEPVLGVNEYEVSRTEEDGIITIQTVKAVDTDSNGILDYLDSDVAVNYNLDT